MDRSDLQGFVHEAELAAFRFEGLMLVAVYIMLGIGFFCLPAGGVLGVSARRTRVRGSPDPTPGIGRCKQPVVNHADRGPTMTQVLPEGTSPNDKHRLDPTRIIQTAENLARRVSDSLPESTLAGLAVELAGIARATDQRVRQAGRPIYTIRVASFLAIGASLLGIWYLVVHIHTRWEFGTITEVFEATDAGFNLLVLLAGALWFLFTLEGRAKRKKALAFLGDLREFIHVIDVTQLYYTPDIYKANPGARTLPWISTTAIFCTAQKCSR